MGKNIFKENTKQVNQIMAQILAWCALAMVALLITDYLDIFSFNNRLRVMIIGGGFFVTLSPIILLKLKVNSEFLKYYMIVSMAILIGLLGTSNGIGIYITYALVPIASCMYFDRKFTITACVVAYFTMAFGVYENSANKLEVRFKDWTHMETFVKYMIGFTIEYVVIVLFTTRLAKRTYSFLEEQQDNLIALQKENEKQKEIAELYKDSSAVSRNSILDIISNSFGDSMAKEDNSEMRAGHRFLAKMQESIRQSDDLYSSIIDSLAKTGEFFEIDRIWYAEPNADEGLTRITYQWSREKDKYCSDFALQDDKQALDAIHKLYDDFGYMEFSKDIRRKNSVLADRIDELKDSSILRYLDTKRIGSQVWIPIVNDGRYSGSICFERYSADEWSNVEIFLLAEISSTISLNIARHNADKANQAKSNFLSSMSHEIRTPMNAILGMTTVALREDMNDTVRKSLKIIRSSSEGLLAIINDILDFSKIESGRIDIITEDYQTLSLLNDVSTIVNARNSEKGLELIYDIPENLPTTLHGDMVRIKQVMVNLANNAVKYTDKGSVKIIVRCENNAEGNATLKYSVVDTGQGIKEEDKNKLFNSFSQVNQEKNHHKEGTGLGLAISKQLVELMGGSIGVESTYGVGSNFFFEIPQKIVDATPAGKLESFEYKDDEEDEFTFTAPDAQILIVDDNAINLMVAEALLKTTNMKIQKARSGEDALRLVASNEYDMIFMDHFMPGMDGEEATRAIRALKDNSNCNVPIIALTADAVTGVKEKMLASGMNAFLSKPINVRAANRIILSYLSKDKIISLK